MKTEKNKDKGMWWFLATSISVLLSLTFLTEWLAR